MSIAEGRLGVYRFKDSPASQLMEDIVVLEVHGPVLGVGLDAADVVGLHRVQRRHELS